MQWSTLQPSDRPSGTADDLGRQLHDDEGWSICLAGLLSR